MLFQDLIYGFVVTGVLLMLCGVALLLQGRRLAAEKRKQREEDDAG